MFFLQICVHWDIQSHGWSEVGSSVVETNSSHTTRHFTYLSTYAVITKQVIKLILF